MIKHAVRITAAAGLTLLAGCSYVQDNPIYGPDGIVRDRSQDYEKAQPGKKLEIPSEVASRAKATSDQLVVPEIDLAGTERQTEFRVPRPEFFYADAGSETVNFKRIDSERVIVVDEPIADVWVKVHDFWSFNGIELVKADPQRGIMESGWIELEGKEYDIVDGWIRRLTFQGTNTDTKNKLQVSVRPDPENYNRTAISIKHVQYPSDEEVASVDWSKQSRDVSYKSDMMFEMLRYMSKASSKPTARTLLAMQQSKKLRPQLGRDSRGNPVLKIDAPVSQAWSLTSAAMDKAELDVGTRDKEKGIFYMTYTTSTPANDESDMGFFEWLHSDREDIKLDTSSLEAAAGFAGLGDEDPIAYSAKEDSLVEGLQDESDLSDPTNDANKDGYKIWFAGKVIYVFDGANSGFYNEDTGEYEHTGRYQVRMNRVRTGTYLSVHNDQGLEAPSVIAEEILWEIKDRLPRG